MKNAIFGSEALASHGRYNANGAFGGTKVPLPIMI